MVWTHNRLTTSHGGKINRPLPCFLPPSLTGHLSPPLTHMTDAESVLLWGLTKLSVGRGRLNPVNWVIGFLSSSSSSADLPSLFHGCNPHDRTKSNNSQQQSEPILLIMHVQKLLKADENLVACVRVRASVRGAIFNFPSAIVVGRRPSSVVAGTRAE